MEANRPIPKPRKGTKLKTERLSTLNEAGERKFVIPGEVTGPLRRWRNRVYAVLLLVFLVLPWTRINGMQSVWLDVPRRRFEIFGQLFLSHDAPLLFFLLAIALMALAFVTAVWGRVWCGWACPQTVFIDAVYRRIEIWVEGEYKERRKLRDAPMSWSKLRKTVVKWALFFVVSSVIAHSFLAYFTGSRELVQMILNGRPGENINYFLLVTSMTAVLLFNFGWFREQFCTIMCPYGRLQAVLMDDRSLAIVYDEKRGEPRKSPALAADKRGDCVSCNRCVEVCPAAIDIRDGLQMECIGCTACIDACNIIMKKVDKPEGLIRYRSVDGSDLRVWRPRTIAYFAIALFCTLGLVTQLADHAPYAVSIFRAKDAPYQVMAGNMVLNHLKAHLLNQSHLNQVFTVRLTPEFETAGVSITQVAQEHRVLAGEDVEIHFFLIFPKSLLDARGEAHISVQVYERGTGRSEQKMLSVVGPIQ